VLTDRKVRLLRESFALIEPHAGIAGLVFYRNLFNLDPSLRPLFKASIELQAHKLMEALSYTIATLENPRALVPVLEAMGRRHVTYGTRDEHYDTVIQALLLTLAETLTIGFSAEVRTAWNEALTFVADTMKRGAEGTAERLARTAP
jgi:hemoglobin-like flavoprotein